MFQPSGTISTYVEHYFTHLNARHESCVQHDDVCNIENWFKANDYIDYNYFQ